MAVRGAEWAFSRDGRIAFVCLAFAIVLLALGLLAVTAFGSDAANAGRARGPSASKTIAKARKTNAIRPSFEKVHSASRTAIQGASTRSAPNLPRDTSSPKLVRFT